MQLRPDLGSVTDRHWGLGWWTYSEPAMRLQGPALTLQLGLQYEGLWNDLRGTSSTGHRGYERLSNKLWLLAQTAPLPQAELQLGLLLRGWQDSWLSQANQRLPDITNVQHKGVTLRYRHSPWWIGSRPVFPWLRYTQVAESDKVGSQRWYEPRNRSMELGLEVQF